MGVIMVVGNKIAKVVDALKSEGHIVWDVENANQFRDYMSTRGGAFDLCLIDPATIFEGQSVIDLLKESHECGDFVPPIQLLAEDTEVRKAITELGFQVKSEDFKSIGEFLKLL